MPVITKITQQKKDNERYNIFLDEKYAFSVHETVLVKFGLTKGMSLEDWSIEDMVYDDEIQKAFNRALHYLGFRMRSEFEVKKKLLDSGYGESVVMEAIVKLKRLEFINDESFTEAFLQTQKNTTLKGPRAIKAELQKKGIGKDMQEKAMESYTHEEQLQLATKLAEKTARSNESSAPMQVKQKIQNALLRKGFSFDMIAQVIDSIDLERGEDQWDAITETTGEKAWRKYSSKYDGYERKKRVKQAMYQKGIPFDMIDEFIEKKEQEDGE